MSMVHKPGYYLMLTAFFTALFTATAVLTPPETKEAVSVSEPKYTLVIDAGHGGEDGGAQSDAGMLESEVNLSVCRKMNQIAKLCGISAVLTRDSQKISYPEDALTTKARKTADQKNRVALVNSTENAILISVHQNLYPDPKPRGPQVLYGPFAGSDSLGKYIHENMTAALYPENRRVLAPISDTIYLMRSVHCPAVLVECGFLSNPEDAAMLESETYRVKVAAVLIGSYMQYLENTTL